MTDIEAEVRKLTPEDGDVIVLRTQNLMTPKARQSLAEIIGPLIKATGKKVHALVLEDGMTVEVLRLSQLKDREVAE